MNRFVSVLVFAACVCGAAAALSPEDRLREGLEYYALAQEDPGYLEKAKESLGPLAESLPLAKAYYGCLRTMEAGAYAEKNRLIKAMSLLKEGASLMDEAAQAAPDVAEIRFIRLANSYDLSSSSPFNRDKVMKEDLLWIEARADRLEAKDRGVFLLYKGLYLLRMRKRNDARAAFEECRAVSPGSPEAAEAEERIAAMEAKR